MKKVGHIAWDDGVVGEAIEEVTGIPPLLYQKTTKTRCGKQVKLERVNNKNPSCPDCVRDRDDERAAHKELGPEIMGLLEREGIAWRRP